MDIAYSILTSSWLFTLLGLLILILASVHILHTRDQVSDAAAWLGMVWLVPILGLVLYFLLGVNRIKRRAAKVRPPSTEILPKSGLLASDHADYLELLPRPEGAANIAQTAQKETAPAPSRHPAQKIAADLRPDLKPVLWAAHARLADKVTRQPLVRGNKARMFTTGRNAYKAMLDAIDGAEQSVALTTYIFQADLAGRKFLTALKNAHKRGVEIRVLVDAVGNVYGLKPISPHLRRAQIKTAIFNPLTIGPKLAFFNLRTHRKLLLVDGRTGFAGGMNIRVDHLDAPGGAPPIEDRHFAFKGPIVHNMMEAFADDWLFSSGEQLEGPKWYPKLDTEGGLTARSVADGPDHARPQTRSLLLSALASAQDTVTISTPYFLPDRELKSALSQAALRGVKVSILIPEKSNLPLFDDICRTNAQELLENGVTLHLIPPPFDHSKILVIDTYYALIGSSNWDARSLRLNFEYNLEVFGTPFAQQLVRDLQKKYKSSRPLTLDTVRARSPLRRAVGRTLWLFSPYL